MLPVLGLVTDADRDSGCIDALRRGYFRRLRLPRRHSVSLTALKVPTSKRYYCELSHMVFVSARMEGLRHRLCQHLLGELNHCIIQSRLFSSFVDFKKLRPMILKRIENRAKDYPIQSMIPVAEEVIKARTLLIQGVSTLLKVYPVTACKFCPEVYVGERGHLIQTCCGYKRRGRKRVHEWVIGGVRDILVPVEAFHLQNMFQDVIKHQNRFDYDRVPAVLELCWQAGALESFNSAISEGTQDAPDDVDSLSSDELRFIAAGTLRAWETVREGVKKLLLVYPAKVCEHCSEVHVGPSGHKARLCGVFKYESWRGTHFWKKADVDDLFPSKIVWHRRLQDPPALSNEHRDYYGHAPAVVDLCTKAGVVAPTKYFCMMKVQGLSGPHLIGSSYQNLPRED